MQEYEQIGEQWPQELFYKIYEIEEKYPNFNVDSATDDRLFDAILKKYKNVWDELAKL